MSTVEQDARLLYVDDDVAVAEGFARTVQRHGFDADIATSGADALRVARTRHYAVIVTDLRMPGLDGLSLIEQLSPICPTTTFVMVTGLPDLDLRASRHVDSAIASVVVKPWDEDELVNTLTRAVALHHQRAKPGAELVAPRRKTPAILLVEDNPADADLMVALLAAEFPSDAFTKVSRLNNALECVHEETYEAIIADMVLPDARGFDVVTRLQAAAPATPIIVVSGLADEELAQQVVQLGAQDFLIKGSLTAPLVARAIRHSRERKRAEQRLMNLAHYDQLTGLANRATFYERIAQAATRARRRGTRFAVMYLDLDKFKSVNDTMGHDAGDALLEEVGRRIRSSVRDYDTVARLGGDEFAVLADELDSLNGLDEVSRRIASSLSEPMKLAGRTIATSCSIGVAVYPDVARNASDLIKCADDALYQAKRAGRNRVVYFDAARSEVGTVQSPLAADLNVALKRGEFRLYYQPQVALQDYRLQGFELLLRWQRGTEVVPPSVFVPLLEEAGGMVSVGNWAMREAARQLAEWRRHGAPNLRLAINLSLAQVEEPGAADSIVRALKDHDLPADAFEVEVSEQVLMRGTVRVSLALTEIKQRGLRLAVKGFGTGFASRDFLARFGVDTLKVSRTFVSAAPDDTDSASVVRAIVALGASLGVDVLADGVETRDQLLAARSLGCRLAQGYLFGRPRADWTLPPFWGPVDDDAS